MGALHHAKVMTASAPHTANSTSQIERSTGSIEQNQSRLWPVNLALIIVATVFGAYHSSLGVGFLLDDFSHLDTAFNSAHSNPAGLIRSFTSNWTGAADDLTSYRPLISLSYCIDYAVWRFNAAGFHLSNLLMFSACSVLTAAIGFELSALASQRRRLAVGALAGLLFAVYPLHPESVAWIIGRVDVQCGMFYFLSLYLYLLSRRTENKIWYFASLISFCLALPSKEMAVTLPMCIALVEVVLPTQRLGWQKWNIKQRLEAVAPFFALLGGFAIVRTLAIGTVVGGYGATSLKTVAHSFINFADGNSWLKVVYGVNEEIAFPAEVIRTAFGAALVLAILLILRLSEKAQYWRTLAFLGLWAVISELPTFQIWHIYPNLCGSRLLFIPSAPLCIALSMVALPQFRFFSKLPESVRPGVGALISIIAPATIGVLAACWFAALECNLSVWADAGNRMRHLTEQVRAIALQTPAGKVSLLIDLPSDHSGAGLIGRPEFLDQLLRPPLYSSDLRSRIITSERAIPGSHEFISAAALQELLKNQSVGYVCKYDEVLGAYVPWLKPRQTQLASSALVPVTPAVDQHQILWFSETMLDPFSAQVAHVSSDKVLPNPSFNASLKSATPTQTPLQINLQLVWRSTNQPKGWIDFSEGPAGLHNVEKVGDELIFVPGRYRAWLLNGNIRQIGLRLPPGLDLKNLKNSRIHFDKGETVMPQLLLTRLNETHRDSKDSKNSAVEPVMTITRSTLLKLHFDVSRVHNAAGVKLVISKAGIALPDMAIASLPDRKHLCFNKEIPAARGDIYLGAAHFDAAGLHQIAAISTNGSGKVIGLLSEPQTVRLQ